jgi:hypothetical protein
MREVMKSKAQSTPKEARRWNSEGSETNPLD